MLGLWRLVVFVFFEMGRSYGKIFPCFYFGSCIFLICPFFIFYFFGWG